MYALSFDEMWAVSGGDDGDGDDGGGGPSGGGVSGPESDGGVDPGNTGGGSMTCSASLGQGVATAACVDGAVSVSLTAVANNNATITTLETVTISGHSLHASQNTGATLAKSAIVAGVTAMAVPLTPIIGSVGLTLVGMLAGAAVSHLQSPYVSPPVYQ